MPKDSKSPTEGDPSDPEFTRSSRKATKLSQAEVGRLAKIPEKILRAAEVSGGPLTEGQRERLAKVCGVGDPSLFMAKKDLPEALLLQAGGLCGDPSVEHEGAFQDFECGPPTLHSNLNCPVALLWADSRFRSYVQANVCFADSSRQSSYLRIAFRNGTGPYPVSIGIHPKHMVARRLSRHQLGFRFRVLLLENANPTRPICMVVRVSDAAHRQWSYHMKRATYRVFPLDSGPNLSNIVEVDADQDRWRFVGPVQESAWTQIDVRTKGGSVDHQWTPFLHDERTPNLDVVTRVTLEFGAQDDAERPRGGEGVVLISPIEII